MDVFGRERGRQRHVAAREALGQAEKIGRDAFQVAGEEGSGAAEADGDLIGDEQGVVFVGKVAEAFQVAFRVDDHSRGALDEGFDDDRDHLAGVFREGAFDFIQAGDVAGWPGEAKWTAVAVGAGDLDGGEEKG